MIIKKDVELFLLVHKTHTVFHSSDFSYLNSFMRTSPHFRYHKKILIFNDILSF
jgi:hypothetical protein